MNIPLGDVGMLGTSITRNEHRKLADLLIDVASPPALDCIVRLAPFASLLVHNRRPKIAHMRMHVSAVASLPLRLA